jgi:hypothetical protein
VSVTAPPRPGPARRSARQGRLFTLEWGRPKEAARSGSRRAPPARPRCAPSPAPPGGDPREPRPFASVVAEGSQLRPALPSGLTRAGALAGMRWRWRAAGPCRPGAWCSPPPPPPGPGSPVPPPQARRSLQVKAQWCRRLRARTDRPVRPGGRSTRSPVMEAVQSRDLASSVPRSCQFSPVIPPVQPRDLASSAPRSCQFSPAPRSVFIVRVHSLPASFPVEREPEKPDHRGSGSGR